MGLERLDSQAVGNALYGLQCLAASPELLELIAVRVAEAQYLMSFILSFFLFLLCFSFSSSSLSSFSEEKEQENK